MNALSLGAYFPIVEFMSDQETRNSPEVGRVHL